MKRCITKSYWKLIKNNMKKTWSIIKNVKNNCKQSKANAPFFYNNSVITDKKIISDKFNDYFINVGKTLAAQIPKSGPSFDKYFPEPNPKSIFLVPTNEREIGNIILNMKNSAPGHGGISAKVIKPIKDILAPPLIYITNLFLLNYRPISLLPYFSKLFERLIYDRLINFIEKHSFLYQYQFRFRKNHSTFMALVTLLESVTSALDNLEFSICILIDFRKAFDTVGHTSY